MVLGAPNAGEELHLRPMLGPMGAAEGVNQSKITLAAAYRLTDQRIQHGESASNIGRRWRSERADLA